MIDKLTLLSCTFYVAHLFCVGTKIMFIDVGQGNCTIVLPEDTAMPSLLIDGGSKGYLHRVSRAPKVLATKFKSNHIENRIKDIASHIIERASLNTKDPQDRTNCLLIVVSHPDTDHYDWLPKVYALLKNKAYTPIRILSLTLGGDLSDYKGEMKKLLNGIDKDPEIKLTFPAKKNSTSTVHIIKNNLDEYILLPVLARGGPLNAADNDLSIIVLVVCGNDRSLIAGDATKNTIKHIRQSLFQGPVQSYLSESDFYPEEGMQSDPVNLDEGFLKTDIFLASHHGADNTCNTQDFLEIIRPDFIVFSSGVTAGNKHPRESVLRTSLAYLPDQPDGKWHSLYFGIGEETSFAGRDLCHAEFMVASEDKDKKWQNRYGVMLTRKHIYGTIGQGDIWFTLTSQGVEGPHCERDFSFYDPADDPPVMHILNRCQIDSEEGEKLLKNIAVTTRGTNLKRTAIGWGQAFRDYFSLKKIVCLNFSGLGIDCIGETINLFDDIDDIVEEWKNVERTVDGVSELIQQVITHSGEIKRVYLNNNFIDDERIIRLLAKLLTTKPLIERFFVQECGISSDSGDILKLAWDNRGLKF